MNDWFSQNWQSIVGTGTITTIINYLFNKKNSKADFLTKVEAIYSGLVDELKEDRESLKVEIKDFKSDLRSLQDQFNTIQLAYAREVEVSQNWEKLHRQLMEKHEALARDHEALKLFCEKLKLELDKYKKTK
jgi:uncharacterized coiled-coil DUF342 family protein